MPDQYTVLLELRRSEGAARGLSKIPHDFYPATASYLAEVRRTFEGELRENPSGRKGELARQTYQRASQVARDVIEARMTKILSLAFQSSIAGTKDAANALPEERALFEALVGVLREHRGQVAPFLEPPGPRTAAPARPAPGGAARADRPGPPDEKTAPQRVVRILKESRALEIGPETLQLAKEDLLTLPAAVAQILIDGQIAEAVDASDPAP